MGFPLREHYFRLPLHEKPKRYIPKSMIDRATIDKIMDATNIVDVVSEFVTLKKTGVNYKGLCPFHDDKTPSFIVSPAKGICHCFACGKGGNAVNFLMEHEQMDYPGALRWLANKYNIEIKERELSAEEQQAMNDRESMFVINAWARDYFQHVLHNDPDGLAVGMQYFRSRGFRDDIISKFQLGFALTRRDSLAQKAKKEGYKEEYLIKTGLCYKKDNGELVDRFAGRVIFPWISISGKVNAFGGRLLDSRTKGVQQKYVNSPESDIYHKDHELYGLFQAKRAIAKEDKVYMVEGYTDVISMHQNGIENVVANSGTALSVHQVNLLRRFTQNITLLYDGDEAGIHAALRGTDMMLQGGMNVKVLLLPDGDDPDSFSRKHSTEEFLKYVEDHQVDFIIFKSRLLLEGVTDPIKRSEAISSIIRSVSVIPDPIKRDTYIRECSRNFQMNEQTLINTMNRFIGGDIENLQKEAERQLRREETARQQTPQPAASNTQSATAPARSSEVEKMLIQLIIQHGEEIVFRDVETEDGQLINLTVAQYIDYDFAQDDLHFTLPLFDRILHEAAVHSTDESFKADTYFTHHPDIEVNQLASTLAIDHYQLSKSLQMRVDSTSILQKANHLIVDFRIDIKSRLIADIRRKLAEAAKAADNESVKELMKELIDAQRLRDTIAAQVGRSFIR